MSNLVKAGPWTELRQLTRVRIALGRQTRVAPGHSIGAQPVLVLIGERPSLSASDSLGACVTWQPHSGRNDAERNGVSTICPEGFDFAEAAHRMADFGAGAKQLRASGIALKEGTETLIRFEDPDPPPPIPEDSS